MRKVIGNLIKAVGVAFFITLAFIGDEGFRSISIADLIGMDSYIFTPVWIIGGFLILVFGFYIEGEDTDDDEENETENE